jgi:hypothetical protein
LLSTFAVAFTSYVYQKERDVKNLNQIRYEKDHTVIVRGIVQYNDVRKNVS